MKFQIGHKIANTHSLSYTREYRIWSNIKRRCYNKNHPRYNDYGGRGIYMDEKWINDPVCFIEYIKTIENYNIWLNNKSYSIDRIDNDGGYIEGNLRFIDKSSQLLNTRFRIDNKTGCKGVYYDKRRDKFALRIGLKYIGMFNTIEECIEKRNELLCGHIE